MFKNLDDKNCPLECSLKNKGCLTDYDGSSLTLVTSTISFVTTENEVGQVSDVCVQCFNGVSSDETDVQLV